MAIFLVLINSFSKIFNQRKKRH